MAKEIYYEDINVGDAMPEKISGPLVKLQLVKYAGASGDFNPLHVDDDFAKSVGMDGVIAHGMLVMGILGQALAGWIPKKYLKKYGVRFAGMTKSNETVIVSGKIVDKKVENGENLIFGELFVKGQGGDNKLDGHFTAALPSKG